MAYDQRSYHGISGGPCEIMDARGELTLPSLLKRLEHMVNNSAASLSTAAEIRSRVCGSRPEKAGPATESQPSPNGLLEQMQLLIDVLGQNLERTQDEQNAVMSRIT